MMNQHKSDLSKLTYKDLSNLPTKSQLIFSRALPVIIKENLNLETFFKSVKCMFSKKFLDNCGFQDIAIECTDTSKDFCATGKPGFGSVVIFAVFLPGLIQAVANIIYFKVNIVQ